MYSRIEDEWLLASVLGFGVLFGKGGLFGAPRIVRDEAGATGKAARRAAARAC